MPKPKQYLESQKRIIFPKIVRLSYRYVRLKGLKRLIIYQLVGIYAYLGKLLYVLEGLGRGEFNQLGLLEKNIINACGNYHQYRNPYHYIDNYSAVRFFFHKNGHIRVSDNKLRPLNCNYRGLD